jgi:hypothetical protein
VVKEVKMGEAQNGARFYDEIDAQVDRELAAEEARRRATLREEIASKQRREQAAAHYDHINRRDHPAGLPPSPEEQAVMDAQLVASRKADAERREANERRFAAEEHKRVENWQRMQVKR